MCLAVLALERHPRFPLVLAANRDEFFDRAAAPLDAWQVPGAGGAAVPVLAGRDLQAGGTWFGLGATGRLALLTNVRDPSRQRADAPSRGRIVADWLGATEPLSRAAARWAEAGHNGFNVIAADLARGDWHWTDSRRADPQPLAPGLHGLSNASLDTPWPKVLRLRAAVETALGRHATLAPLLQALFDALIDPLRAPDPELPDTGLPLALERALSSVFIRSDDRHYGTRCSTVLVRERTASGRLDTWLFERTFPAAADAPGSLAWTLLPGWPDAATGRLPAVRRCVQPAGSYRTTLPNVAENAAASW